jgi:hypothetical protein
MQKENRMKVRSWLPLTLGGFALSILTLPVQALPAADAGGLKSAAPATAAVEQAHYRRHHRHYRYRYYYREPGVHFYYGHRHRHHHHHHRHSRHW